MPIVVDKEVHTRTIAVTLSWPELEAALVGIALKEAGVGGDIEYSDMRTVRLRRLEEGSPAYPTDKWTAEVSLQLDVDPRRAVAAPERVP